MAANTSDNFFLTLLKFIGFLLLLVLSFGITHEFVLSTHGSGDVNQFLLPGAVFFAFFYYLFIKDLNEPYKKVQSFLFRVPWLAYSVSFLLVLAAITCLVSLKIFSLAIDRNIFVFLGGFIFASHLIYISYETRGETFSQLTNYLFGLNVYYLVNLICLGLYFCIIFNFNVLRVFLDGSSRAIDVVRNFFF